MTSSILAINFLLLNCSATTPTTSNNFVSSFFLLPFYLPKLPISTPDARIKNIVQFLHKTHNKTSHFVTFFSISPLFVQKVRRFLAFLAFFFPFPPPIFNRQQQIERPSRRLSSAPITGSGVLKAPAARGVKYAHLFASFFSIFLTFASFFPFSLSFCHFFPRFFPFLKPLPPFLTQNQPPLKPPIHKST